ncbi:hypothetical protein T07_6741 [Trichinella nelsoni]|uniref:Uncharacterized protein n=1 Tax=Trichinella nelsoni TaxID=6336 RepID=A0A0V0SLA9_9BILA|nr:hypothetical protein T07_6741 [Trichinella nelsoni]
MSSLEKDINRMFFTNDENTVTYFPVYQCTIALVLNVMINLLSDNVCSIRSSVSEVAAIRRSISMHLTFYFEITTVCRAMIRSVQNLILIHHQYCRKILRVLYKASVLNSKCIAMTVVHY